MKKFSFRSIFDQSFAISFFAIAIVSLICSYGTTSVAHKLGFAGTNVEFGLVLGGSVASVLIASKLVKIVTAYGGSITGRPPLNAEFLFYLFLDARKCDTLVGDLEERHKLIQKKFGARKANFWYWTQAMRSVGPIVWAWMKKVALKPMLGVVTWAIGKGLLGNDSWLAALVEIWKRIRS